MQVFKVVLKTIRKNLNVLSIYLFVFVGFLILMTSMQTSVGSSVFYEVRSDVMIINRDSGNIIADSFAEFMKKASDPVAPVDTEEEMLDALFNEEADYILVIPEGFSEDFLSGTHKVQLEQQSVAGSRSAVWVDMKIRKYMDLLRLYSELTDVDPDDSIAIAELSSKVETQMNKETKVIYPTGAQKVRESSVPYFFKFMGYALMAITILGVGTILKLFTDRDFKNRLRCSPQKTSSVNLQLVLGNFCFAFTACAIMILVCLSFGLKEGLQPWVWIMVLNAFVFMISTLCLSVVIGLVVKSENVRSLIANVVALGSSFLSGIFVPIEFQSETVRKIAGFLPAFWYVKAVEEAKNLTSYAWRDIRPIAVYMVIQLGFGVAFICVAMAVSREKSRRTI